MRLALKLSLVFLVGISAVLIIEAFLTSRREIAFYEADARRDQSVLGRGVVTAAGYVASRAGKDAALQFIVETNHAESLNRVSLRWIAAGANRESSPERPLTDADWSTLREGRPISRVHLLDENLEHLATYLPLTLGDEPGALEVSESLADQEPEIRSIVRRSFIASAEVAGLCALLALVVGMRLVGKPVTSLIRRTRGIAAGDLESRIHLRQRDELKELAEAINSMCGYLAEARQHIADEHAARLATLDQLRHADRLKTIGQLASGVAHELGTPINVIIIRAKKLAAPGGRLDDDHIRVITEQANRMTRIIRQLLDFARPRTPQHARVDLAEVIAKAVSLLDSTARRFRVTTQIHADGRFPIDIDPDQILQVVSNLMLNAIQAMPEGGTLTLDLSRKRASAPDDQTRSEADYLCLQVRDEGEGIAPELLSRIFEPFFTTKDVGEGTGLGLSVSQGIVREHGGWISVTSATGKGTCFEIYLPLEPTTATVRTSTDGPAGVSDPPGRVLPSPENPVIPALTGVRSC